MPTLYSYCIPVDDGAAPNPFWGVCTLVICKPKIRKYAQIGDWIVGTGSANSPIGDIRDKVVYAMRVSQKMTMRDYELYVQEFLPNKIAQNDSSDIRVRRGDAIYDFSSDPPTIRASVHNELDRDRDLGGEFALLSDHFYYFGDKPRQLPHDLLPIVKQGRGYRSRHKQQHVEQFIHWIENLDLIPNVPYSDPQGFAKEDVIDGCSPSSDHKTMRSLRGDCSSSIKTVKQRAKC